MATRLLQAVRSPPPACFQSIGVTMDWRLAIANGHVWRAKRGFQSIGVTKDWRLEAVIPRGKRAAAFPINRRHQGLATGIEKARRARDHGVSNQ